MLADLLLGQYRRRVLALLLLRPDSAWHVREIARLTQTQAGTLNRELAKLADAGVLLVSKVGNQKHYRANTDCPIFAELAGLLRKTAGVADVLTAALAELAERIDVALVFGSVARGEERAGSDIDVLVLGEVSFAEVVAALYPLQAQLGREINPAVYSVTEFADKAAQQQAWALDVLKQQKLFLIGNEHDFGKLAGHSQAG
ncbi:nucleotidyltransferase domain-containing protein [uncultured Deefgea sp.]|uniref:nucleotidyltransferase domain-containing protein n=1 Tax=uncultured Deefgea sp. TaxID=1304914 RepID=UPI002594D4CB|nr:nucleotidyltransferase domain-containing protein [uncultured Deefgea sp.]